MNALSISENEFEQFQKMIYSIAGISLSAAKKPLVVNRLAKRLRLHELASFSEYLEMLNKNDCADELQTAVDLLTTNETYFFREHKHFDFLQHHLHTMQRDGSTFRVWSAASSTGQEAFSIAMMLDDILGNRPWEILGTDISTHVVNQASQALYPVSQAEKIPQSYLSKYCLKGVGSQQGKMLMDKRLRSRVRFKYANLNTDLPREGEFDVIFLRNVMIYFDMPTKKQVVQRLIRHIKPGGYLFIGHSESLNGVTDALQPIAPAIFRKP